MIRNGYINKANVARGFFFIGDIEDGIEYFAHRSQILTPTKTIEEGVKVEFQLGMYAGRKVALQVKPVAIAENGASL